jgi:hypothetical protein
MKQDLRQYLGISSSLETRKIPVWVLRATNKEGKFRSKYNKIDTYTESGNFIIENVDIDAVVNHSFNTVSLFPYPVIDETYYKGRITISLPTQYDNIELINKSLEKYDLYFTQEFRDMEVIVLRKSN